MSKIICTMASSTDLGLPSRLTGVARALQDRGHDAVFINSAQPAAKFIAESGLKQIPPKEINLWPSSFDIQQASQAFDVEHLVGLMYSDLTYLRALTEAYIDVLSAAKPDVVIDSFGLPSCLAARILKIPLVQITQGNFLSSSPGFLWWEKERPSGLASAVDAVNTIGAEHGIAPIARAADIMNGDLTFVLGSPETDPADQGQNIRYIGTLSAGQTDQGLPDWLEGLSRQRKLIWVYAGNPRYGGPNYATPFDSAVVLDAAFSVLGSVDADVVVTMGFQSFPEGHDIPPNFHLVDFLPGPAIAERCDMMVHHGGHGSMINGLAAGKPAVIIPTNSERESNGRRLALLGAGECVLPAVGSGVEKCVDSVAFAHAVQRIFSTPSYTEKAQKIGQRVLQLGGVREVVSSVEVLLAA